ncbi:MAG: hypothetical protein ACRDCW_06760 [Sarcina sp.]
MKLKNYDEIMELTGRELLKYAIELNNSLERDSKRLRAYEMEKEKNAGYLFGLIGKKETKEPVYENPHIHHAFFYIHEFLGEKNYMRATHRMIYFRDRISKALDVSLVYGDIKKVTARALLIKQVVYFSDSRTKKEIFEKCIDKQDKK